MDMNDFNVLFQEAQEYGIDLTKGHTSGGIEYISMDKGPCHFGKYYNLKSLQSVIKMYRELKRVGFLSNLETND